MQILITGGAGFIGSNLAKRLLQEKEVEVTAIDNLSYGEMSDIEDIDSPRFQFILDDIGNPFNI